MSVISAVRALQRRKNKSEKESLYTRWGEQVAEEAKDSGYCPLKEYPRPQLKRSNYTVLNGYWEYKFTREKGLPKQYDGKILVPFSPESPLSMVGRILLPREYLWYRREFVVEKKKRGRRLLLHFGAVDQRATVYVNGCKVAKHTGGYLPFYADITDVVVEGTNVLYVRVTDDTDTSYHARGKQKLVHGGMFYTPQSGIWQTVWYEWVPNTFIESLMITPLYDKKAVKISLGIRSNQEYSNKKLRISICYKNIEIASYEGPVKDLILPVQDKEGKIKSWSPEHPYLYSLQIKFGNDNVSSYFAMRKIHVALDEKHIPRIYLNNKVYFQNGVLDQGYWPDGLYTAPSDKAYIYDINMMKRLGFTMIRKHVKIEPLRFYYHCDRMGMLVWQDMVNGGDSYDMFRVCYILAIIPSLARCIKDTRYWYFKRKEQRGRDEWKKECFETLHHLYNCPSIVMWVLFNEGWGQFDSEKLARKLKKEDPGRLVDHASGWFDQKAGDVRSEHNYFRKLRVKSDDRPFVLSEFGGYVCQITGHVYSNLAFGYKMYQNRDMLTKAFYQVYDQYINPLKKNGLCASVYTQLSDVEEETNGLLTYDRKCVKIRRRKRHVQEGTV